VRLALAVLLAQSRAAVSSSQPIVPVACTNATGPRPRLEPSPGVLYPLALGVELGRFWPSTELEPFVEHYWWVRWDVETPFVSEVLSYPSVHVVFEGNAARIVGIVRARFSRRLEGRGSVFAIKFRPGMFRSLRPEPAWQLTDRTLELGAELGAPAAEISAALRALPTELERAKLLDERLRAVRPPEQRDAVLARGLVDRVRQDSGLQSVVALASIAGLSPRALQRLFRAYVGIGPKWVVRRFRLQEAAERLQKGSETIASVAQSLGYFDQAHFDHDFKAVVGSSPLDYVSKARRSAASGERR
jgi:AraC-like DNA-binding protein